MKRFLALILALLLCLGLVSCDVYEEESFSSSEETSSVNPTSEQSSEEKIEFNYFVESSYEYYTFNLYGKDFFWKIVSDDEQERGYKLWFFKNYDECNDFFNRATQGLESLWGTPNIYEEAKKQVPKENDFDDHFIVALFISANTPLRFGNITSATEENKYIMTAESEMTLAAVMPATATPENVYFILIPRTSVKGEMDKIEIDFYVHYCDTTKTPFEYYDIRKRIVED